MTTTIDFCTEPAGYTERAYSDTAYAQCTQFGGGGITEDSLIGFHSLCPADCRINYYWPRNGTGNPSYARVDFTSPASTSTPDYEFAIQGSWNSGNYSWGTALVGIGAPGTGDAFIVGPRIYVSLTNDDDLSPSGPKFTGHFTNDAGTTYSTARTALTPRSYTGDVWSINTTIRQYIEGTTGYVVLGNGTTVSVALSGSFAGTYSRWESWHGGGGGSSSNNGGAGEGRQTANGAITSVRVFSTVLLPTVGFIGLTP